MASPAANRPAIGQLVIQLGWPQFWLLTSSLAGILSLVGLALLAAYWGAS